MLDKRTLVSPDALICAGLQLQQRGMGPSRHFRQTAAQHRRITALLEDIAPGSDGRGADSDVDSQVGGKDIDSSSQGGSSGSGSSTDGGGESHRNIYDSRDDSGTDTQDSNFSGGDDSVYSGEADSDDSKTGMDQPLAVPACEPCRPHSCWAGRAVVQPRVPECRDQ